MCDKITQCYSMIISSDHITHDNDWKLKEKPQDLEVYFAFFYICQIFDKIKEDKKETNEFHKNRKSRVEYK